MNVVLLEQPQPIEHNPLRLAEVPEPTPGTEQIRIRVTACGLCHTDLHIIEGELPPKKSPLVPGHQIVGIVDALGPGAARFHIGDRVGVPWLHETCGACEFCLQGRENLCLKASFTGYDVDGGFAEYALAPEAFVHPLPLRMSDLQMAPLLCAGAIGYRALKLSEANPGQRLGLYGFGASAHIVIQIAANWGCRVYVFSRSPEHRRLAEDLGAVWTGSAEQPPPKRLHSAIIFAPAGAVVPYALEALDKGGVLALAGIYMSPVPKLDYTRHLYHEKTIRSVANSTRQDVRELLTLAADIPLRTEVQAFSLEQANEALLLLKQGRIQGAGVLETGSRDPGPSS